MSRKNDNNFFEKVFCIVKQIPLGKVTSYGAIARYLGTARSARMVGWAMNSSVKNQPGLPAHRVVNRYGQLTGKNHFGSYNIMAELLINEGINVAEDRILNFDKVFWDPCTELDINKCQ
jgi:methylated-DNA-protein-cysteine methyltransferase related protein